MEMSTIRRILELVKVTKFPPLDFQTCFEVLKESFQISIFHLTDPYNGGLSYETYLRYLSDT